MRLEGKPREVKRAVFEDDRGALSAMGRKGAKVAAENRAVRKAIQDEMTKRNLEERAAEEAKLFTLSSEGDVLPPDDSIPLGK